MIDWKSVKLKSLLATPIQNGYSPICPEKENGKWVLSLGALTPNGLDTSQKKPAPLENNKFQEYELHPGDFLVSRSNTVDKVGRSALFKGEISNCLYPDLMMRFRVNQEKIYPEFMEYFLRSNGPIRYFRRCAAGTSGTMVKINKKILEKLSVPIPPYTTQKKIADTLTRWSYSIQTIERLITAKQELRKGLMQQLLSGTRRFPGFTKRWKEVRFSEVFTNRTEAGRTDLPLVSITGSGGVIFRDELDRKDTSSADKSKYLRICPGDIGYNTMRMWQGVSGLSRIEGIVSPAYTIVTPNESLDPKFMALLFKYPPVVHLFYRYSQGLVSDTWNLKFRHFSEIRAELPEKKEQETIAAVFRPIDKELDLLQQQLAAFTEQKKGLMQQLLNGKVRVKVDEGAVA